MNLTCDRIALSDGLKTVMRAVSDQQSLPILANLLLRPGVGSVELAATDLEMAISCRIPAEVRVEQPATVPAKVFAEILFSLPKDPVTIETEGTVVRIRCARSEYRLHTLPATEFPPMPSISKVCEFSLPQSLLKEMLRETFFAVSKDDTRPVLTGVSMVLKGGQLTFAATNAHRLAVRAHNVEHFVGDFAAIVPGKALSEVARLIDADQEAHAHVHVGDNQIGFRISESHLVSRLIEGKFPNYECVIPAHWATRVTVAREPLLQAVKRAAIVAGADSGRLQIALESDTIRLHAESPDLGSAEEHVTGRIEGPPHATAFNARYLLEGLGVLRTEDVTLECGDPVAPCVLRPVGDSAYFQLLMPMQ